MLPVFTVKKIKQMVTLKQIPGMVFAITFKEVSGFRDYFE